MQWEGSRHKRFKDVYDEVYPIIFKVVYRIVGHQDIAEDVVQEAFIRYFERMETIPDPDGAKYWLIRVSKNLALNYAKRKGRERRAYEKAARQPRTPQTSSEVEMMKEQSSEAVQQALEQVPENLRMVLILKEYGNLSYKEIGDILGITEGNVKVRAFRAREKLSEILDKEDVYVP